jgi:beta-lactam-binding protein with PASTA domain
LLYDVLIRARCSIRKADYFCLVMRLILKHLSLVALVCLVLATLTLYGIRIYTNHDSELVPVTNLEGMNVERAIEQLDNLGLTGVVTDTVYKDGVPKLSVINQNPVAGLKVKPGRKVYLVINTNDIPMVEVPSLAGQTSLQQAKNILLRRHLKVGRVIEKVHPSVRSRSDEPVLAQYKHGTKEEIKGGSLLERNSKIDLVIGIPSKNAETEDGEPLETEATE